MFKAGRERLYLAIILLASFIVRLIPSRTLSFAGNDAYVHHDIVMRIVTEGPGIVSHDIPSLMGLKAYAYPPLFHLIASALYTVSRSDAVFFLLPAFFGTAAVLVIYMISLEISGNHEQSLLSALLFSMTPSFVTRTSTFMPESLGILLFTGILWMIVRYIKTVPGYPDINNFELGGFLNLFKGDARYLLGASVIFIMYPFTHRGWIFLAIAVLILIATFLTPSFRKRPLEFGLIFAAMVVFLVEFIAFAARFQAVPVTILGFPKWMGVLQLVVGLYGALILLKSRNPVHRFLIIWAAVFMIIGTYSFRFRDPYAAIPLTLIAGYGLMSVIMKIRDSEVLKRYPLLKWDIGPALKSGAILLLILVPVSQGAAMAYSNVITPSPEQISAFSWIEKNTPQDAVFMARINESYLLIGNTHRRDVLLWNTVYRGFMGDAPSVKENRMIQKEVSTIFDSSLPPEAYYLIEKNNISYLYLTRNDHKSGIGLYAPYDPHFKTVFVSGDVSVYRYIRNPELESNTSEIRPQNNRYGEIIGFIEKFWNGYSYSEAGGNGYNDPARDLEFGSLFKGSYESNAMIAALYLQMGDETGDASLTERGSYLIKWLAYRQMDNGSFPAGMPPAEYTLTTTQTIHPLMALKSPESNEIVSKGLRFVESQTEKDEISIAPGKTSSTILGPDYLKLKTESQVSGMKPEGKGEVVNSIIREQGFDGAWSSREYENIGILKGLALYYISTKDEQVLESVQKGAEWLRNHQNTDGSFQGDGEEDVYCLSHYSDAALIYSVAGDSASLERTVNHIIERGVKNDPTPLRSFMTLIWDMKLIYGDDRALEIAGKTLHD